MIADDVTQQISLRYEGANLEAVHEAATRAIDQYKRLVETVAEHHELCGCQGCQEICPWILDVHWHGSMYGYSYYKCRCVKCKKAQTTYSKNRKGRN